MKNILLLLLLLATPFVLCAQTYEPPPKNFIWTADSIPKPFEVDSFQVNNFLLGFQWSGSPRMDKALNHNAKAGGYFALDPQEIPDDNIIYIIAQPTRNAHNGEFTRFDNSAMLQYEPTLLMSDYTKFQPRYGDTTNAIFGFGSIYGTILPADSITSLNYNRLKLFQDSLAHYPADSIVLSDIAPKDKFFTYQGSKIHNYSNFS